MIDAMLLKTPPVGKEKEKRIAAIYVTGQLKHTDQLPFPGGLVEVGNKGVVNLGQGFPPDSSI